jgi:hypothetical protein
MLLTAHKDDAVVTFLIFTFACLQVICEYDEIVFDEIVFKSSLLSMKSCSIIDFYPSLDNVKLTFDDLLHNLYLSISKCSSEL